MEEKKVGDEFIDKCYTRQQALRRLRLIRDFLNFFLFEKHGKIGFAEALDEFKSKNMQESDPNHFDDDSQFLADLGENYYKNFTHENFAVKSKELEQTYLKAVKIVVYLPIEPTDQELSKMGKWFKENVSKGILMDIQYDPSLIAGPAFSYKGVYKDYSIRSRIKAQRETILKTLLAYKK